MDCATTPTLQGIIVKGLERISAQAALQALGMERRDSKPLKSIMHSLGWHGPFKARMIDASGKSAVIACYERTPQQTLQDDGSVAPDIANDLPTELEAVTRLGLRDMRRILQSPFDLNNGNLLKAKVTAGLGVINAQLRADEQRLRAKTTGDALARLLKIIEKQRSIAEQPVEHGHNTQPADQGAPHEQSQALTVIEPDPERAE